MLGSLVRLLVARRVLVLVTVTLVAAYGVTAYLATPIEAFPDVTNVQVTVIAQQPGYAPEEIERRVTVPLERALNGVPGMIMLRSESLFGLSLVTLTFDDDADSFVVRSLVTQRVATADLPEGVVPELSPECTPLGEVYQFRVASDRHDAYQLRSELEWRIAPSLRQVQGVADVVSFGGFVTELHVEVDPNALDNYELTIDDVMRALEGSNINVGGGFMKRGSQELVIRSLGDAGTPEALRQLVLKSDDRLPVTLGDVARVIKSYTPRRGTVGENQDRDIAEGFVIMRRGENPSAVLAGVHAKVAELNDHILPQGMQIVPFYDRTTLVDHTLDTVHENLLHGFLLIVGVVWLFLRSLRGTLAVALIIPLSLLAAFIGLHAMKLPANLISMGAIDFGVLVDGAVVLVESVLHEWQHHPTATRTDLFRRIIKGAADVGRPTFYAMTIILASLVPIFSLERVEGRIFRPLALTYAFALIGALVFALTVVPAVLAVALRHTQRPPREPKTLVALRGGYARVVGWLLAHRWVALPIAGAFAAIGLVSASGLGSEFLPELDEGDIVVFVEMPPSIDLVSGQDILVDVRKRLMAFPEVLAVLSEQGRPEDGTDNEGVNMSETFVHLAPRDQWPAGVSDEQLVEAMRASLTQIPGVDYNFSQPIKDNIEEAISGVRGKVVLKIFGTDLKAMRATLEAAKNTLAAIPGIVDLDLYRDAQVPQLRLGLKRGELAREGIRVADAQATIETALAGRIATELWIDERPVPVRVRLPAPERADPNAIGRVLVRGTGGNRVPLADIADVSIGDGRASINREEGSRFLALKFNVEGRDMGSAVQDAIAAVSAHVKPADGMFFKWGGEFENQERALGRLRVIVPIALVIVLALLYGAFRNARSALLVLLTAPFALAGGAAGLAALGIPLSVSAAIGFIALLGQISLMGLLVLSAIEAQRHAGLALPDAIVAGASQRLRPVLMAALLGMLGLIPMVLSTGVGSETSRPFAVVLVFGLASSLLMALFLLPPLYGLVAKRPKPGGGTSDAPDDEDAEVLALEVGAPVPHPEASR